MEVLIRGVNNKNNIENLKDMTDISEVDADLLGQEFRTTENSLSCWLANTDDENSIKEAVVALILANPDKDTKVQNNERLERQDYIVLDYSNIQRYFCCEQTDPCSESQSLTKDLKNKHHDIKKLKLKDIEHLISVYKAVVESKNSSELVVRLRKHEVNAYIEEWNKKRI